MKTNSKLLKRLLRKTVGLRTDEDLQGVIDYLKDLSASTSEWKPFFDDFEELIEKLDSAFEDLEKIIEIRDRTLSVSSRELTDLNEQIIKINQSQKAVLDELHSIISTLDQNNASSTENDVEFLVREVTRLTGIQIQASRDLKLIIEEGQKISSAYTYEMLSQTVQEAANRLSEESLKTALAYSGTLLQDWGDDLKNDCFYTIEDSEHEVMTPKTVVLENYSGKVLNVESPDGGQVYAKLYLEPVKQTDDPDPFRHTEKIQTLVLNIRATIKNMLWLVQARQQQRMESELQTARLVQQTLLPHTLPGKSDPLAVSGHYESASECGGDWWTWFQKKTGEYVVLLGDVTGHGTASAMVCAVVKGYCDSLIHTSQSISMSRLLADLNDVVYRVGNENQRYMTMAAISIDLKENTLTLSNAGHTAPLLVGSSGKKSRYLVAPGRPLGAQLDSEYTEKTFEFHPKDKLFIYSDGLTEATSPKNEEFGERRLRRLIDKEYRDFSAPDLNRAIQNYFEEFISDIPLVDDVTTVVVENRSHPAQSL